MCLPAAGLENSGREAEAWLDTETWRLRRETIARRVSPCSQPRKLRWILKEIDSNGFDRDFTGSALTWNEGKNPARGRVALERSFGIWLWKQNPTRGVSDDTTYCYIYTIIDRIYRQLLQNILVPKIAIK